MILSNACAALAALVLPLADAVPTWTDKEVVIAFGSVLGGVVTAITGAGLLFWKIRDKAWSDLVRKAETTEKSLHTSQAEKLELMERLAKHMNGETLVAANKVLAETQAALAAATNELTAAQTDLVGIRAALEAAESHRDALKVDLGTSNTKVAELDADLAQTRQRLDAAAGHAATVAAELEQTRTSLDESRRTIDSRNFRIRKALELDGRFWEPNAGGAPKFTDLGELGMPVVSVLNLKGGVGKTTVTVNLASALSHLGYRVLLIDLDLQGSLTGMLLSEDRQKELFDADRTIGGYFRVAGEDSDKWPRLRDYCEPVTSFPNDGSAIVPTTDALAYAELNLTMRWLLHLGRRDPRFLLRRGLRRMSVSEKYDIALLDCPPLVNASCINALAASDFALIPTLLSWQSLDRVPALVHRLDVIRQALNPNLDILGVVANRTSQQGVLGQEESWLLGSLKTSCLDQWTTGGSVHICESFIPTNRCIRRAEQDRQPLTEGTDLFADFLALAQELESRMPLGCLPETRQAALQGGGS